MIGPGWMPRPRPLPGTRTRIAPRWRMRVRSRRALRQPVPGAVERATGIDVALPVAALRPTGLGSWLRSLAGDLQRWLVERWDWLGPRRLPIAVACIALFAIPRAVERAASYARGETCERRHDPVPDPARVTICAPRTAGQPSNSVLLRSATDRPRACVHLAGNLHAADLERVDAP